MGACQTNPSDSPRSLGVNPRVWSLWPLCYAPSVANVQPPRGIRWIRLTRRPPSEITSRSINLASHKSACLVSGGTKVGEGWGYSHSGNRKRRACTAQFAGEGDGAAVVAPPRKAQEARLARYRRWGRRSSRPAVVRLHGSCEGMLQVSERTMGAVQTLRYAPAPNPPPAPVLAAVGLLAPRLPGAAGLKRPRLLYSAISSTACSRPRRLRSPAARRPQTRANEHPGDVHGLSRSLS